MSRIKDAFDAVAAAIIAQKDYLSNIDAKAGDGDHGFNMARGFRAAQEIVDEMEDTSQPPASSRPARGPCAAVPSRSGAAS